MIKFKGEVFMMKFVACAEKSETHSIIYERAFKILRNSHKDEPQKERK